MHRLIFLVVFLFSSLCYGMHDNQNYNTQSYDSLGYINSYNDDSQWYYQTYPNSLFIGTSYGFGVASGKKDYFGVSILNRLSNRGFVGIEALLLLGKLGGNLSHQNNFIIGNSSSLMVNILTGLLFRPSMNTNISTYIGAGSTVDYASIASIGTLTSGIDFSYQLFSFLSFSLGYKNIAILVKPVLDLEHYATARLSLAF